jgi:hypothetical protein
VTENKYPIGGYAPGNYQCTCCDCGEKFIGDKRAIQCELCATSATQAYNAMSVAEREIHDRKIIEAMREVMKKFTPLPQPNPRIDH